MHHRLLVACHEVGQLVRTVFGAVETRLDRFDVGLEQSLTEASDVAVTEDAERPGEQTLTLTVAFGPLVREVAHEGLTDGESNRGGSHHRSLSDGVEVGSVAFTLVGFTLVAVRRRGSTS